MGRFKVLRAKPLQASVARRTVTSALERHDFARRVVKTARVDCHRHRRYAFGCTLSSHFSGYQLKGGGQVKLGVGLSCRFRVKAQGVHFTLTDDNEAPH